mmetsp:Transcript_17659/g.15575  ORF Transcript_17659/g.15575 Transcript_17659/m.15575 type:complete len:303 (+) Transcript_17659:313-1221(+)
MLNQMSDADLIPDMQKQIDIYKQEFQNYNDQENEQKKIIEQVNSELDTYKKESEDKDKQIKHLTNDHEHMRVRFNSLQKTLQEQSEYIDDIKGVHEDKTKEKAEEIIGQFHNILGFDQDQDQSPNLKSKISSLQDENLILKETVLSLKNEMNILGKESENSMNDDRKEIEISNENTKEVVDQSSKYLELMQEVTEYKSELEDREQELKDSLNKSKESETLVESLSNELNKSKHNAKEYIMKKEKEIERLKTRLRQNSSLNGVSSGANTSGEKTNQSLEISNENNKSDIPDTFFNESSEEEPE